MKVSWSEQAVRDIEHIRDYIAQDSAVYAQAFIARLLHTTRHLSDFPYSGRPMPEADDPNIRELIYQGYRIIYRLRPDIIEIVIVAHGSRDLSATPNQPWLAG